jgi:hypothetical protein
MNKWKLILFILSISFCSSVINAQYLNELRLKHDATFSDTINSAQRLTEKSPLLAGTLSFIVPGLALGQFYNGQILKGVLHVSITGLGFVLFLSGMGPEGSNSSGKSTAYAGFLLYLGNWIYTTFEAIAAAENINKQIMLQKYRSDILNRIKLGFGVNRNKQLRINFAFEL